MVNRNIQYSLLYGEVQATKEKMVSILKGVCLGDLTFYNSFAVSCSFDGNYLKIDFVVLKA